MSDVNEETQTHIEADGKATEALKAEVEKYKNEYLYLRAEFDTYRRNMIKERADLTKYGNERLANEILNIIDNFDRALSTKPTPENMSSYVKGVEMTANEMKSTLSKFGITEVPSVGLPFDPNLHEAVGSDDQSDLPAGHISKVLRKPYRLHDRLIRPGQVVVSNGPKKS